MVIDKELLELLACPETHQPLADADGSLLSEANARIAAGTLMTVGGDLVSEPLEAALVREDGRVLYPIRDAIPILLVEEGLVLVDEPTRDSEG